MRPLWSVIKNLAINSSEYTRYLVSELLSYINYINAVFIGMIINFFIGNGFPGKLAPYIVPLIVQSISKSAVKFNHRHMQRLLQLPSEREDPVFIMNGKGDIILSTGLTLETFQSHDVKNIIRIIGDDGFNYISNCFVDKSGNNQQIELFSDLFNKWYNIKIKPVHSSMSSEEKTYLIWFTDITEQKKHEERMSNMLKFSGSILSSLPKIIEKYDVHHVYDMLAEFVLSNDYSGAFITTMDKVGNLRGYVCKNIDNRIEKSKLITIRRDSSAPVLRSREKSSIVIGDISTFASRVEFEMEYPFDERVKEFLGFPIDNFINYHEVNVSVIAFNKAGFISKYDKILMEIMVNNAKTVLGLVEYISTYNELCNIVKKELPSVSSVLDKLDYKDDI